MGSEMCIRDRSTHHRATPLPMPTEVFFLCSVGSVHQSVGSDELATVAYVEAHRAVGRSLRAAAAAAPNAREGGVPSASTAVGAGATVEAVDSGSAELDLARALVLSCLSTAACHTGAFEIARDCAAIALGLRELHAQRLAAADGTKAVAPSAAAGAPLPPARGVAPHGAAGGAVSGGLSGGGGGGEPVGAVDMSAASMGTGRVSRLSGGVGGDDGGGGERGGVDADAALARNNLGVALHALGDCGGAMLCFRDAHAALSATLGAAHPRTATARHNLSLFFSKALHLQLSPRAWPADAWRPSMVHTVGAGGKAAGKGKADRDKAATGVKDKGRAR